MSGEELSNKTKLSDENKRDTAVNYDINGRFYHETQLQLFLTEEKRRKNECY